VRRPAADAVLGGVRVGLGADPDAPPGSLGRALALPDLFDRSGVRRVHGVGVLGERGGRCARAPLRALRETGAKDRPRAVLRELL